LSRSAAKSCSVRLQRFDQSAVDNVIGACDVAGPLRGEHDDESGDFFGRGEATGSEAADTFDDLLARGVRVDPHRLTDRFGDSAGAEPEIGANRSRRDVVDTDTAWAELLR